MKRIGEKIIGFIDPKTIEKNTMEQLENLASMPFIHSHVAVMPDCHLGKGATVGSVIATRGAIIPAAVGVDIGCGMIAVKTNKFAKDLPDNLEKLRSGIERRIPLSAGKYNKDISDTAQKRVQYLKKSDKMYNELVRAPWELQLGSLGSGNHFIEICLDEDDRVWVVLHSGSRGIGNQIAQKHIKIAKKLMDDMFIDLKDKDLAYLPETMREFDEYIADMLWSQEFALFNREEMMDRVMTELSYTFYGENGHQEGLEEERINCHHNFTQKENHLGKNVWLTRKGAIQMKEGQKGIIPGSMGTKSYIVSGLANKMSFNSAPHGAGRRFSRTEARKRFTMDDFDRELKGVVTTRSKEFIDEIPSAYKDIDDVMENAKELVKIDHVLKQIINVKGN